MSLSLIPQRDMDVFSPPSRQYLPSVTILSRSDTKLSPPFSRYSVYYIAEVCEGMNLREISPILCHFRLHGS